MTINVGKIKVVLKFHLRTPCLNLRLETAIKILFIFKL